MLAEAVHAERVLARLDRLAVARAERHLRRVQELVAELLLVDEEVARVVRGGGLHERLRRRRGLQLRGLRGRRRHARVGRADRDDDVGAEAVVAERRGQERRRARIAERAPQALRREAGARARVVDGGREEVRLRQRPRDAGVRPAGLLERDHRARRDALDAGAVDRDDLELGRRDRLRARSSSSRRLLGAADDRAAEAARDRLRDGRVGVLELGHGRADRLGRGRHDGRAADHRRVADEPHLHHLAARDLGEQLDVAQDRLRADRLALRRAAHLEVVGQRVEQAEEVRARRPDVEPPLELAHERLLARRAQEVGVEVAVAHVLAAPGSRRASGSRA